jgi:ATPase family associated with various cellular activities (AAA)
LTRELAAPPATGTASGLISILQSKAPRIAMALAAGQMAWPAVKTLQAKARARTTYTVKVPGSDAIYDDLHEWVLSLLPSGERRALVAWSSKPELGTELDSSGRPRHPPSLRLRYDGTREQVIQVAGYPIKVAVTESSQDDNARRWKPPEIVFTARSAAGRDALVAEVSDVLRRSQEAMHKPSFRMLDSWGSWERLDDLPPRSTGSVILPDGQMQRLIADVERFLASEQEYVRKCIPWHRGHLYEGIPGSGKTSVARAIASHFGMDVWYLPLADVKKDGNLLRLAMQITPRSMLLLEDIDVFHAATERDDKASVTLSGLLNALDGIATPHGLLTVMTTNTPDVLDDAVVRAGRVDLVEHFSSADAGQVARLLTRYYGYPVTNDDEVAGCSPAEVVEACKRHDSPADALADLSARRRNASLPRLPR